MRGVYVFVAFVIGLFFVASISVNAAMQGHSNLHGQKQGEIKGQNVQSKTPKSSKSRGWDDINLKRGVIQQKQ